MKNNQSPKQNHYIIPPGTIQANSTLPFDIKLDSGGQINSINCNAEAEPILNLNSLELEEFENAILKEAEDCIYNPDNYLKHLDFDEGKNQLGNS